MQIQLNWKEINSQESQKPLLEIPVAIGRDVDKMPRELNGKTVSQIILIDGEVAEYHALLDENNGELIVVDQNTSNGIKVNGVNLPSISLEDGDILQIGNYQIQVCLNIKIGCDRLIGFLFKRRCGRTNPIGCSYCQNGQGKQDPYYYDRAYYPEYGYYNTWGRDYYYHRDYYYYDRETGNVDFTEADAEALANEFDTDYEQDMGES